MSAPSFVGCWLFPPCRNMLARNFVWNATYDGNKRSQDGVHTQKRMAHSPIDHEAVRAKQWNAQRAQHSGYQRTMPKQDDGNKKRETRYNIKYPTDAAASVFISNETYWYMLLIIIIIPIVLHSKYLLSRLLSLARPTWQCILLRSEIDGMPAKLWVVSEGWMPSL